MGGEDESGCSGGFQYVSRKAKPRRNRRRGGLQKDGGQEGAGKEEEREERLAKRCEIIAARKAFLSTGDAGRQMDMLLSAVDARQKGNDVRLPTSILALGLGSVKESRPAQLQLAFMLLVRDWLSEKGSRIVDVAAYDPVFDDEDRDLLAELAIRALDENVQGYYPLQHAVFAYMPHCTKTLYENILRANWSPEGLDRLWLCCNDLERYVGKSSSVKETAPCITRIGESRRDVRELHK